MELKPLFQDIADAIRKKDGTAAPITASAFPARIRELPVLQGEVALQALRITAPPTKQTYTCSRFGAEAFDPSGLELEADLSALSNAVTLPIPLEYAAFSPEGPLPAETEAMTISFRFGAQTVTASLPVTVQYGSPTWAEAEGAELTWRWFEDMLMTWAEFEST